MLLKKQIEANNSVAKSVDSSFEILLVDNNSNDETKSLKDFEIEGVGFRYFVEMKAGLAAARNKALREFEGDLICFLDDDVLPQPGFIAAILKISKMSMDEIAILGARVRLPEEAQVSKFIDKYSLLSPSVFPEHDYGNQRRLYPFKYKSKIVENPIGACFLLTKAVALQLSMFNENLGVGAKKFGATLHEDTEFFRRALKENIKIEYFPELCVEHPLDEERLKPARIYNWYFNSGKSFVLLAKHKPEIFSKRNQADFVGVPTLLLKVWPKSLNFDLLGIPFYMHFKLVLVYLISVLIHLSFQEKLIIYFKAHFFKTMGEIAGFRLVKMLEN